MLSLLQLRHPECFAPSRAGSSSPVPTFAAGEHGDKWKNTKVFPTYQSLLDDADSKPTAAFIGLPPKYHGALEDTNANIEVSI